MGLNKINVEVVYALPEEQKIISIQVVQGTSLFGALLQSGILDLYPQIDIEKNPLGLFGKIIKNAKKQILNECDRIEIYRPLLIDPKQARINRAAKNKEQ